MSTSDNSKNGSLAAIIEQLRRGRRYANFFESIDKATKEWDVGQLFLAARRRLSGDEWHDLESVVDDPPDLACVGRVGERIAIELTEIVCYYAVRRVQKGHDVMRVWRPEEIRAQMEFALSSKDRKQFRGGPWSRICVCMYSDELMINPYSVQAALSFGPFGPFDKITDAYMLLSYEAARDGQPGYYPLIPVPIASVQP